MKLQGNETSGGGGGGEGAELFVLVAVDGKDSNVKTRSSAKHRKTISRGETFIEAVLSRMC